MKDPKPRHAYSVPCFLASLQGKRKKIAPQLISILQLRKIPTLSTGPTVGLTAALEMKMSILPKSLRAYKQSENNASTSKLEKRRRKVTFSTRPLRSASFPTWQTVPTTSMFSFFRSSTVLATFSCLRELTRTLAPSRPSRRAMAKPILGRMAWVCCLQYRHVKCNMQTKRARHDADNLFLLPLQHNIDLIAGLVDWWIGWPTFR